MNAKKYRVVHYVNQFFGQIGGEDKADVGFSEKPGPLGPGLALQNALGDKAEIVATIICGDNYFAGDPEKTAEEGLKLVAAHKPDIFFAGPAFAAGRYGVACGAMCKAVENKLSIPVVSGMYFENPGVDMFQKNAFIVKTGNSARDMAQAMEKMVRLGLHLASGEINTSLLLRECRPRPEEYDYYKRVLIRNEFTDKTAAERTMDMLMAKLKGEPFESDVVMPEFEKVEPPPPVADLSKVNLCMVSDGGLVPKGNPDGMSGRGNLIWSTYDINEFLPTDCSQVEYEVAHTGYFSEDVLADPKRLVPVDAVRKAVDDGRIGQLHHTFFSTSGNATVTKRCEEMGEEIGAALKNQGIEAVIHTST